MSSQPPHERLLLMVLLAFAAASGAGCSQGIATGTVSGEVTLDGKPLPKGHLEFVPVGGQGQTAGAMIADGKFSAEIPVAKMTVKIHAPKVVKSNRKMYDAPNEPFVDDIVEALPAKYNEKSDLML